MLQKYEGSKEYVVDLLMDWDDQRVSIYINDEAIKSASFFTQRKDKLEFANALSIYGLSPGSVSKFKDVRVCNDICSTEESKGFTDLSGATFGYTLGALGLSALYLSLLA